jgi:hypothetical protein
MKFEVHFEDHEVKKMKIRTVMLVGVALLMGRSALAQECAKWEIPI